MMGEFSYFAQVTGGIVTDLRKTTRERIEEYPDLYIGQWVQVTNPEDYPALGWLYDGISFSPPSAPVEEEVS